MEKAYAEAIIESLNSGLEFDQVLSSLKAILSKRGHERLYPAILRTTSQILTRREETTAPQVRVAKVTEANSVRVKEILTLLKAEKLSPRVVVDETIIGGRIVRFQNLEVDESYKSTLLNLYQKITK